MTVLGGRPLTLRSDVWELFGTGSPVGDPDADYARGSTYRQTDGAGSALWVKTGAAATAWALVGTGGGGSGDVTGPASSVDNRVVTFDGTTGKVIQDSGVGVATLVLTTGTYSNPAWLTGLAWSKVTGTPTTATGYGIASIDGVPVGATTASSGRFTSLEATGNVTLGDASTDTVTVNGRFVSDLLPSTTATRDLGFVGGLTTLRWRDLWLSRNANIGGNITASDGILQVTRADLITPQASFSYDGSNRLDIQVNDVGRVEYNAVGSAAIHEFRDAIVTSDYIGAGTEFRVGGTKVVGAQGAAVADPTGGTVQDSEARTAIIAIIDRLQAHGLIA